VYGLHAQARIWQALRAISAAWAARGRSVLASRARTLSGRLEVGLRRAVAGSQRRLGDGSIFVPMRLLDGVEPYGMVTASRLGSYWNLSHRMPSPRACSPRTAHWRRASGATSASTGRACSASSARPLRCSTAHPRESPRRA
jgi:hypothetical protein